MKTSRNALLAQIHMASKALNMEEADYRGMLAERYGVDSAARLGMAKLEDLIRHFESLGWAPVRRPKPNPSTTRLCARIWAQCYSLGRPVPAYADAIARQMFGIDKAQWCTAEQLRGITTALAKLQEKEGALLA